MNKKQPCGPLNVEQPKKKLPQKVTTSQEKKKQKQSLDKKLDKALEETFPASDPISVGR